MMKDLAGQYVFVGGHVGRRLPLDAVVPSGLDPTEQSRRHGRCDFVLNGEDAFELAAIAFSPKMRCVLAVDDLYCASDPVSGFATAPLRDSTPPQLALALHL